VIVSLSPTGIVGEIVAIPGPLVTPKAAELRAIAAALQKTFGVDCVAIRMIAIICFGQTRISITLRGKHFFWPSG
jgi:hypothetical protein